MSHNSQDKQKDLPVIAFQGIEHTPVVRKLCTIKIMDLKCLRYEALSYRISRLRVVLEQFFDPFKRTQDRIFFLFFYKEQIPFLRLAFDEDLDFFP